MSNQIHDNFDRSEFSDEVFSIFGRALAVASRFESSCKSLARIQSVRDAVMAEPIMTGNRFAEICEDISIQYRNLNQAIESMKIDGSIKENFDSARIARNDLVHEAAIHAMESFDLLERSELNRMLEHVEHLVLKILRGDVLVSTLLSIRNKEQISDYPFSKEYEARYVNWVMKRLEQ